MEKNHREDVSWTTLSHKEVAKTDEISTVSVTTVLLKPYMDYLRIRPDNTGLQKNFPRIRFQYSVSFSPAEYEFESHFFPSRQYFPKIYDKCLKINKIGCL